MTMRLLITGGAGCLGSNLIEYYHAHGHDIIAIDNFETSEREVLFPQSRLQVVEGSVADESLIKRLFSDFSPTHVIHCAATYKDPENWTDDIRTNVLGTVNIIRASEISKVSRLVNLQTALCYGRPESSPIPVDHRSLPFSSYGISKTAGEAYLRQSSIPYASLRLANICAPRLAIGPIPTFYKRLKLGETCFCSESVRDFLHIGDFIDLMDLILLDQSKSGIFNVSTGKGHSILEVYREIEKYLNFKPKDVRVVPVRDDDVKEVVLDPSYTESTFNWTARTDFRATIKHQLEWYDMHGVDQIYSHLSANHTSDSSD